MGQRKNTCPLQPLIVAGTGVFGYKELLHASAGGNDPLDLVGRLGALYIGDLHQTIQLHWLLTDKHILSALAFVDLCNKT